MSGQFFKKNANLIRESVETVTLFTIRLLNDDIQRVHWIETRILKAENTSERVSENDVREKEKACACEREMYSRKY